MNKRWYLIPVILGIIFGVLFFQMFKVVDSAQNQRDYLIECTTPGTPKDIHECFDDGQKRLAQAIAQISDNVTHNIIVYLESHKE